MSAMQGTPDPLFPASNDGLPHRIHFLGAGGAGVSGAARVLHQRGHALSGHDRSPGQHVELLRGLGVHVEICPQESARLPQGVEMVVRSAAIALGDPQLREASERNIPVLKYAELLGRITPAGRTLAVAGTHGKTTSSWLAYHACHGAAQAHALGLPGAIIGGICGRIGANSVVQEPSGLFVVEACEYDRSFLNLVPYGALITNVEDDHLDYFGSSEAIHQAFSDFAKKVHPEGLLVIGEKVPCGIPSAARCEVWRFGSELLVDLLDEQQGRFVMRLRGPGFVVDQVRIGVPGEFNVENAALALGLVIGSCARVFGLAPESLAAAAGMGLQNFAGANRRFESWGNPKGIELVHDYAHHPTEVRVTLDTARSVFPGRPLHVLFQPHQHSRTARFLDAFVESLRAADRVVIADVYGARTHIDGEQLATAGDIVSGLARMDISATAPGDKWASARAFAAGLPDNAVGLILGAGDIDEIKHELLAQLACAALPRVLSADEAPTRV